MKISFVPASLALSAAALIASAPALAQAAPQTILIGLAAPLTGPSARIGQDLRNGAQLAIDDANAKHPSVGGKPVVYKLVAADDQSDPRTAVTVAQQLVDQHVAGVVGHWNTGCSVPASRVYRDAGIPQIAPASTGHQYTQQGYTTAFRIMGHDDAGGTYTGAYAVKTLKAKRIAVIDDRTSFGSGLATQFIKGVEANGGTIVDRQYVNDKTTDFSGVLTAIEGKRADLVFFGGLDAQAAPIARRMRQLGVNAPLLGAGGFVSQTFLSLAGKDGDGVTALEPGLPLARMPGGGAFDAQYRARYRQPIELHAPFAYDAAATLIAATQQAGTTQPAKLVAAVHAINRSGVTGAIAFDEAGNLKNPAFTIYQVRGGKWTVVDVLGGTRTATK
ncbi:branched-chain amino acid ABC transporter substrate-binding protein [Burkholderia stagnalis]|uniref:branched-chain amino acid ABC transporter substrate-binding protein n=1 Tax=Burkholderia stagnalis TaxID=1503054 RepID=UPI000F5B7684|nr:branched-chain amino acid ABC transporter substrate-binding protein [Burkholderia stagnalis]RQQ18703.1 branched-chain amino acid ABC transporter substrate-binding protein [Burkholderia stagnalis]RQR03390.1 branched-chain amino acid ABC transporter substrate-binding protein [Burkholderia stagnalis]RQX96818.1 branched-chain amino acid ABC transporter substrate-binding protein [Burkholderia stagnalis]RQY81611.1 branched-chain amino acid ABC transporter substrate-binding protein [Burkholderia st